MLEIMLIFIEIVLLFGFCWWNKVEFLPVNCQNVFLFCDNLNIPCKQGRNKGPIIKNGVKTTCNQHLNKSFCGESGGAVFSKRAPLAAGGKDAVDSGKLKIIKVYSFRIFHRFKVIIDNRGSSSAGIQRLPKFLRMDLCTNGHERRKQQIQPIEIQF
jgi:hypothetical protein